MYAHSTTCSSSTLEIRREGTYAVPTCPCTGLTLQAYVDERSVNLVEARFSVAFVCSRFFSQLVRNILKYGSKQNAKFPSHVTHVNPKPQTGHRVLNTLTHSCRHDTSQTSRDVYDTRLLSKTQTRVCV